MGSKSIRLDQKKKCITIQGLTLEQRLVFEYFDKQPDGERDRIATKAFLLGVLALNEERLAAFLGRTANTLGTELESLKFIFELNEQVFYRTTGKGREVEHDIVDQLTQHAKAQEYTDIVEHCGEVFGELPKNKTGDIVILVNGEKDRRIVLESKFDKAKRLGAVRGKDIFAKGDTAFGQLLEAKANRKAQQSIIIFDESSVDGKLKAQVGSARFYPHVGFVCIVDYQRNNFDALFLCYELCRALVLGAITSPTEHGQLALIVARFLHDLDLFLELKKRCQKVLIDVREMIDVVERAHLSLEFTKEIFSEFCKQGYLTNEQLIAFYSAEAVKERYALIRSQIEVSK